MSPTVFRYHGYRFFFFSREENRKHIHVYCADGEAKFWIDPKIELANNIKLSSKQVKELEKIIKEKKDVIHKAWDKHFKS